MQKWVHFVVDLFITEGIFAYLRIKNFSNQRLVFFLKIITSFWHEVWCSLPTNYKDNSCTYLFKNIQVFFNNI